jgi:hypothetical protein
MNTQDLISDPLSTRTKRSIAQFKFVTGRSSVDTNATHANGFKALPSSRNEVN